VSHEPDNSHLPEGSVMAECDVEGCQNVAVAEVFSATKCGFRCPDCLHYDGSEEGWW